MPDVVVVYGPDEYREFLGTARHEEMKEWLAANGINPADVAVRAEIAIERETYDVTAHADAAPVAVDGGRVIRYAAYLRNADGAKYLDEDTGFAAQEERNVPLVVDPPPHWREKETDR